MPPHNRRSFLELGMTTLTASALAPHSLLAGTLLGAEAAPPIPAAFPRQDPEAVEETVRVAHSNLTRVKELVEARPALARAAVDWGFGDWEDALGAASHTGRCEIAEFLIAHGARPTLFSAAMMGQLEVVKAFLAAAPGSQSILGPHNLTLLSHAKAGGERARGVREFLEQIGGADPKPDQTMAFTEADRAKYAGTYVFGATPGDVLIVSNEVAGLSITRPGLPFPRGLAPVAPDTFSPTGARAVRIKFTFRDDGSAEVGVFDPGLIVRASRPRSP